MLRQILYMRTCVCTSIFLVNDTMPAGCGPRVQLPGRLHAQREQVAEL